MKEVRYFYVPQAASVGELPEEEAVHALRVLRLKEGDELMLMDGKGTFYKAIVTLASSKRCLYSIQETMPQQRTWNGHIHLAIAPTKMMERIEWMTEKATEIGFDELSLLDCKFSERRVVKTPRLEKIVISAVKQSRKAWTPIVNVMLSFDNFIKSHQTGRRYIAHCYEEVPRTNLFDELRNGNNQDDALVMIGPEGDFSIDEVRKAVEAGFISVNLGDSRLRTETAGLAAIMMIQLSKQ
ncbi:16S rRNA (uracil(1498)-N(3))-methyltransferase [Xylanibacter brevis]|uniref:16S rRNA (uracil(1498)-N(3))-methyltransferase n=1 Tax=Xylanibacter brevis TaxID=83231 RepID=UPI0004866B5A|nr:16S rRNA (uracil(1498)-N(3))-methyltransferase [Xylanibacter brevis]